MNARIMLPKKNHRLSRLMFIRESAALTDEEFRKWTAMYRTLDRTLKSCSGNPMARPPGGDGRRTISSWSQPRQGYAAGHPNVRLEVFQELRTCGEHRTGPEVQRDLYRFLTRWVRRRHPAMIRTCTWSLLMLLLLAGARSGAS